jgi:hypothetical protein
VVVVVTVVDVVVVVVMVAVAFGAGERERRGDERDEVCGGVEWRGGEEEEEDDEAGEAEAHGHGCGAEERVQDEPGGGQRWLGQLRRGDRRGRRQRELHVAGRRDFLVAASAGACEL